jgi:xylulokinase
MDVVLGLDLGTTNCKVLAVDESGQPVANASMPTPVQMTWTANGDTVPEYDAEPLWNTSARLIQRVMSEIGPGAHVAGIAVASMAESGVLLDAAGQPLAPIITWYDSRSLPWLAWWQGHMTDEETFAITGLAPRHIFTAYKLLWYRDQQPELLAQAQSWLCVADWITFRLSAQYTMSYSMASRTLLFDVSRRAWSDYLFAFSDLPKRLMPPVLPSGQVIGWVTAEAARMTGLREGTPVVTGGHDHICAALAAGVIAPGPVLDSSGTTEPLMVALDTPALDSRVATTGFCCGCHTVGDRYYLLGGIMAGAVVDWMSRLLGGDDTPTTVSRLMEIAATSPPGANGVWFLPYLDGSGPPKRDPEAWGAWLGLRLRHTQADVIRAAMEGLTFGIRALLDGIQQAAGFPVQELRVVGGGSRNTWWQKLKADILGVPIETLAVSDVTAQGAALLAGIGVGMFADEQEAASRTYRPATRYQADPVVHAQYDIAYRETFARLCPALKALPLTIVETVCE